MREGFPAPSIYPKYPAEGHPVIKELLVFQLGVAQGHPPGPAVSAGGAELLVPASSQSNHSLSLSSDVAQEEHMCAEAQDQVQQARSNVTCLI